MTAQEELDAAQAQVELKKLEVEYNELLEGMHGNGLSDKQMTKFRKVRDELVAARQAIRVQREADAAAVEEGSSDE
jgi:hypothetical protein